MCGWFNVAIISRIGYRKYVYITSTYPHSRTQQTDSSTAHMNSQLMRRIYKLIITLCMRTRIAFQLFPTLNCLCRAYQFLKTT